MWDRIFEFMLNQGGFFGIAVFVQGYIIYYLNKVLRTSELSRVKELMDQNLRCLGHQKEIADNFSKIAADNRDQVSELYHACREEAKTARSESKEILTRSINANEKIVTAMAALSSPLGIILDRLKVGKNA